MSSPPPPPPPLGSQQVPVLGQHLLSLILQVGRTIRSVVNSPSDLIPATPFLMAFPSPSSPLFSLHYLSFRLLGGRGGGGTLHFSDCHIAFYHHGLQFGGQLLVAAVAVGGGFSFYSVLYTSSSRSLFLCLLPVPPSPSPSLFLYHLQSFSGN